ncbi:MAG: hypothetical protein OXQ30_16310 [Boseongicola sp.]|nr:hypothetical protein [Boseongicola sp.]
MTTPERPLFLAKQSYRRRRLADAARLLPVVGIILVFLPVLWADDARSSGGLIYVFFIWAMLIIAMAFLSRRLSDDGLDDSEFLDEPKVSSDH